MADALIDIVGPEELPDLVKLYNQIFRPSRDLESFRRWYEYSRARDAMLAATDTKHAPWYLVRSDDKKRARLNCISHLLSLIRYGKAPRSLRLSRLVLAGAFGSWSESLGEGSNLPYLHDLTSRYWDSLPSSLRIGALNRGLQRPAPQLPCPQKGKQ